MMRLKLLLIICTFSTFSFALPNFSAIDSRDTIPYTIYDTYESLDADLFQANDGKTVLVNFWATWCGPCVKELPLFEALNKTKLDDNLKIVLVSLDFTDQLQRRFVPFIKKHELSCELAVLADMDANKWIDMVDPSWSGTIPGTLVIKSDQRLFTDDEFKSVQEIKEFINKLN